MKVKVFVIINVCVCVRILYMCVWNTSWQRQFYLTCAVTQSECVYLFFIVSSALTVPVGRSRWTTGWNTLHEPRPGLLWTFLLCMWLPWQPFKDVRCSCKINTRQMAQKETLCKRAGSSPTQTPFKYTRVHEAFPSHALTFPRICVFSKKIWIRFKFWGTKRQTRLPAQAMLTIPQLSFDSSWKVVRTTIYQITGGTGWYREEVGQWHWHAISTHKGNVYTLERSIQEVSLLLIVIDIYTQMPHKQFLWVTTNKASPYGNKVRYWTKHKVTFSHLEKWQRLKCWMADVRRSTLHLPIDIYVNYTIFIMPFRVNKWFWISTRTTHVGWNKQISSVHFSDLIFDKR